MAPVSTSTSGTTSIPQTPKPAAALTSPPPHRGRKKLPDSPTKEVSVFSPYKPPTHLNEDAVDLSSEEFQEAAEKTNHWASFFFAGAIVIFLGLAGCAGYAGLKGRVISVFFLLVSMAFIVEIMGIAGLILQKKTKVEPAVIRTDTAAPVVLLQEGYFPGIINTGNTCFINAPTQAFMQDSRYPGVFQAICKRARMQLEAYQKFLALYPSQSPFALSLPKAFFKTKAAPPLAVENMRDVLIMLMMRKSSINYSKEGFQSKYPTLHRLISEFSKIRKYDNFPLISDADSKSLRSEFGSMVDDPVIVHFFYEERTRVAHELLGFEAYLYLLQSYEEAVRSKSVVVSFRRGYVVSSPIDNIRNLFKAARGDSQEDVEEFLHCLSRYIQSDDYPEVFFPLSYERTWEACPESDQNNKELEETLKKRKLEDITLMPRNKKVIEEPVLSSILQIKGFLFEGVDGQILVDEVIERDCSEEDIRGVYLDEGTSQPKMYRLIREKILKPNRMPERIILELIRVTWDETVQRPVKGDWTVNMPETLKLMSLTYSLKSVVVHSNLAADRSTSADAGHYHAVVKKQDGQWLYASDSSVLDAQETHRRHALGHGVLYFYEKI